MGDDPQLVALVCAALSGALGLAVGSWWTARRAARPPAAPPAPPAPRLAPALWAEPLQNLCNASPVGLLVVGEGARLLAANADARALLRLPSPQGPMPDLRDLLPADAHSQAFLAQVEQCRKRGHAALDLRVGDLCAALTLRAVALGELQGVLVVCERATPRNIEHALHGALERVEELQQTQNTLTSENRVLAQLSRMRGELMADFSHDLRTPITTVRGRIEILLRAGGLSEPQEHSLRVALRAVDRILAMIAEHQADHQREPQAAPNRAQEFDLGALVAETVGLASLPAAQDGVALQLHRPPEEAELMVVSGNPSHLQRLLTNLLGNARKFTPRGGRIDVSLRYAVEPAVELRALQEAAREEAQRRDQVFPQETRGAWVHLQVKDTGSGIASAHLPRIFDRYFTLNTRNHRGTGLGLSICQSIAHAHGGFIKVHSQLGAGATFDVWLPVALQDEATPPAPTPSLLTPPSAHPRHRVVAVDDDPDIRDLLHLVLSGANMEVEVLPDERGLATSLAHPTSLLLLDFTLPKLQGHELIARLRAAPASADLPIVVLSARDDAQTRALCMASGATDFLVKPFEVSDLIARVRRHARLLSPHEPGGTIAGG